jgi:hypothetical protein
MSLWVEEAHRWLYHDTTGTVSNVGRDEILLTRKLAVRSGNSLGVNRTMLKDTVDITHDLVDGTSAIDPSIVEIRISSPEGQTNTNVLAQQLLRCASALVATLDSADFKTSIETGDPEGAIGPLLRTGDWGVSVPVV